ncbi:UNVERIFIED_CONTAM: hypothetical protein LBW93_02810 [Wolbachia endosymbiont of Nasonia longicornis]
MPISAMQQSHSYLSHIILPSTFGRPHIGALAVCVLVMYSKYLKKDFTLSCLLSPFLLITSPSGSF